MSRGADKPTTSRQSPPPPRLPRVPFFHGDVIADGGIYSAAWDAFQTLSTFVSAATLAQHLDRLQRRVEWLQRNRRHATAARPNVLAQLLFGKRTEPTNVRDWKARRAQIEERHAAGQCVTCGVPMPPDRGARWICAGCGVNEEGPPS